MGLPIISRIGPIYVEKRDDPLIDSIPIEFGELPSSTGRIVAPDLAIRAAGDVAWEWDVVTGVVSWDASSFTGWLDTVHVDDRANFLSAIQLHLEAKSPRFEAEYRLTDGKWVHDRGRAERDEFGDPVRVIGLRTSIDARREWENSLRDRARQILVAQSTAGSAFLSFATDSGRYDASDNFEAVVGCPAPSSMFDYAGLVNAEDRERISSAFRDVLETGHRVEIDHKVGVRDIRLVAAKKDPWIVATLSDVSERLRIDSALTRLDAQFRAAIETSFDSFMLIEAVRNEKGKVVDFEFRHLNRRSETLILKNVESVIGQRVSQTMEPDKFLRFFFRYRRALDRRESINVEEEYDSANGRRWYLHRVIPVGDSLAISVSDITRQKLDEIALRDQQLLVRRIGESSPDLICLDDLRTDTRRYTTRSIEAFTGRPNAADQRSTFTAIVPWLHPEDVADFQGFRREIEAARDDRSRDIVVRVDYAGLGYRWISVRSSIFARDDRGRAVESLTSIRDVTEQHEYELKLRELNERLAAAAKTDGLTGVNNRREFDERLAAEVSRAGRHGHALSLVLTDIDDFKKFNDRFGHQSGDDALRTFASVLQNTSRTSDVVARYGGEEFAIICPDTGAEDARRFGQRVREKLRQTEIADLGVQVTASFGVSQFVPGPDAAKSLILRADQALYRSKREGKDRISVDGVD